MKTVSIMLVFLLLNLNENALSLATNLSIFPLRIFLTIPAVSLPALILCIAKFFDERKWCRLYTDLAETI